mmetsp:Transcript_13832/g.46683  ORF Transcript_13832/g.46683 Transcript_13832/m.46683 type:complete len:259 (+) Transcript_13832:21-797(+)
MMKVSNRRGHVWGVPRKAGAELMAEDGGVRPIAEAASASARQRKGVGIQEHARKGLGSEGGSRRSVHKHAERGNVQVGWQWWRRPASTEAGGGAWGAKGRGARGTVPGAPKRSLGIPRLRLAPELVGDAQASRAPPLASSPTGSACALVSSMRPWSSRAASAMGRSLLAAAFSLEGSSSRFKLHWPMPSVLTAAVCHLWRSCLPGRSSPAAFSNAKTKKEPKARSDDRMFTPRRMSYAPSPTPSLVRSARLGSSIITW